MISDDNKKNECEITCCFSWVHVDFRCDGGYAGTGIFTANHIAAATTAKTAGTFAVAAATTEAATAAD